jgi:O-antigen ligase
MPVSTLTRRPVRRDPAALRLALALAVPFIAALTVVGTYLNHEALVIVLWVALGLVATLLVNPIIGIVGMSTMFLLAAYPTVLQSFGVLSLNNLLGLALGALLVLRVLETRDLSFLKYRQIWILAAIGIGFLVATYHAQVAFPLLTASRGRQFMIDKTSDMGHDFVARLAFLVFFLAFVRTRRDVGALFLTFMLALFLAVPSALINWMQGTLNRGFRAAASLTVGHNPNRLAMICLMQIACWWFWTRARPERWRHVAALLAIGASLLVLFTTGSRSGLLGCGVLALVVQVGRRAHRIPARHLVLGAVAALVIVATVVPETGLERMVSFFPERGEIGASSTKMREDTLWTATRMVRDHPVFGIGLGNFREVSRQAYRDKYYRPPHNSYLWAASEGGVFVLALYLVLFWVTWKDLQVVTRLAHRDASLSHIAGALRAVFLLYMFFSIFADLFLSPITYVLIGLIVCMRRYVEGLPETEGIALGRRPVMQTAAVAAA